MTGQQTDNGNMSQQRESQIRQAIITHDRVLRELRRIAGSQDITSAEQARVISEAHRIGIPTSRLVAIIAALRMGIHK